MNTITDIHIVHCDAQCAMLANAAGIGGGPFYIPLFNTLLGFGAYIQPLSRLSNCSSVFSRSKDTCCKTKYHFVAELCRNIYV